MNKLKYLLIGVMIFALTGCRSIVAIEGANDEEPTVAVESDEENENILNADESDLADNFKISSSITIDGSEVPVESFVSTIDNRVKVVWLKDDVEEHSSCDYFEADTSEYSQHIMFIADETVDSFSFLSLNDFDWSEEQSMPTYSVTKLDTRCLEADKPLIVTMTFIGDMPSYGISYENYDGEIVYYSINMSGYDGSLILDRFISSEKTYVSIGGE